MNVEYHIGHSVEIKECRIDCLVAAFKLLLPLLLEVEAAFNAYLLEEYGAARKERSGVIASDLADFLEAGDLKGAMALLHTFLADIPYDIQIKAERYYQTIFYTFFRLVGIFVEAEARTSSGRIDAVVKAGTHIYIFEFKLDGSAEAALDQIRDKEYWLKHRAEGKDITLVGASFGAAERNLVEWKSASPPEPSRRDWHVGLERAKPSRQTRHVARPEQAKSKAADHYPMSFKN